ncbi:MAG: peptidylprolyl isomerase [Paludibacterium sp.]|uniref:peptidylprolyl isomerase n=1 Tax=Paludibacterium sp. TaxID=1917523 RepID=UPI0025E50505|nr:peptidylprolyl isomerase [Paludibacterium sp.]MBV8048855.1 peptidylprolyl isomerase [Paludibacterium sp.]MBV8646488.1 peptidylprolyl isomerase [Paludibacterium sp.]
MKKTLIAGALACALAAAATLAADIQVNGTPISQTRIDAVTKMMNAQAQSQGQQADPRMPDMVKQQLITAEVLSQEAKREGIDKQADVRAEIDNAEAMTLANHLIQQYVAAHPVSDSDVKAEYDRLKAATPPKKSYHAQHILVKTEAEANAILSALKKGKPFAQLAKEKSLDPGSKATGGDLGWNDAETFVGPFGDALTKLAKGQITSKPVQTQYGWHIIKLDDVRTEAFPEMDALRPQLEQQLQSQHIEKYIADLKAKAKIQQ